MHIRGFAFQSPIVVVRNQNQHSMVEVVEIVIAVRAVVVIVVIVEIVAIVAIVVVVVVFSVQVRRRSTCISRHACKRAHSTIVSIQRKE